MEITSVPVTSLYFDEKLYFQIPDEEAYNKLTTSVQRHGQTRILHVVADATSGHLVVGEVFQAKVLIHLGLERALCFVHKDIGEALICTLEQEIRFSNDYFRVADLVHKLNTEHNLPNRRLQHSLPWSEVELNNMQKMKNFDWEKFGEPDQIENQIKMF